MKYKRTITITAAIAIAVMAAFGLLRETQSVQARVETPPPIPVATPDYTVRPGDTDGDPSVDALGNQPDCPGPGIGCDDEQYQLDGDEESPWGDLATNSKHYLYLPPSTPTSAIPEGKLLVFLCGGNGNVETCENVLPVAGAQGYHVIGLAYPTGVGACTNDALTSDQRLSCFGDFMTETITGECPYPDENLSIGCVKSRISEHPQDSVINRLIKVLEWAHANYPGHSWNRYFNSAGVDWTEVHLAGHSNGSSHVSLMGTLDQFRDVRRVALFAGPNDGEGNSAGTWTSSDYIRLVEGVTDTRYYGLIHRKNKALGPLESDETLYEITKGWQTFGMGGPTNPPRLEFDPVPGVPDNFGGSHMLISTNPTTDHDEAHNSVVKGLECADPGTQADGEWKCDEYDVNDPIGYEPAWRCVLGSGHIDFSAKPTANAGPAQTVECQSNGGANVVLDGSGSKDLDCDIRSYAWTGPFGSEGGWNPTVFCPVGTSLISLQVSDQWWTSVLPSTASVTVVDTTPPSLSVTLTPTVLWPPSHQLVLITATVNVTDSCGGAPPNVVLVSIVSDQPDNGLGDGNTVNDIQDAQIETFDTSFLLRAERAGGDPAGRTYTITYKATDPSGNETFVSQTVHVPHSH